MVVVEEPLRRGRNRLAAVDVVGNLLIDIRKDAKLLINAGQMCGSHAPTGADPRDGQTMRKFNGELAEAGEIEERAGRRLRNGFAGP